MIIRVTIVGGPELLAKLRAVDKAIADRAVKAGLSAAANVVEGAAKVNVVEKHIIDTGFLLGSVQAQEPQLNGHGGEVAVTVGAEYAIYHEMGTSRMAARPFMRPALDEHVSEITEALAANIRRVLEEHSNG